MSLYRLLLLWFLGRPVKGIHLGTNYGTPWMEMEGTSNVAIEFEGGPIGYHFGTWVQKVLDLATVYMPIVLRV